MAAPAVGLSAAGWPRRAPWLPAGGAGCRGPDGGAPERRGRPERPAEARADGPRRAPSPCPRAVPPRPPRAAPRSTRGEGVLSHVSGRPPAPALPRLATPAAPAAPPGCPAELHLEEPPAARARVAVAPEVTGGRRGPRPGRGPRVQEAVLCEVSLSPRGCGAPRRGRGRRGVRGCGGCAGARASSPGRTVARDRAPRAAPRRAPPAPGPPAEVCGCRSATPPGRRISAGWGHSGRPGPRGPGGGWALPPGARPAVSPSRDARALRVLGDGGAILQ